MQAGFRQAGSMQAGRQTSWLDAWSQLVQASSWRQDVGKLALNMGIVTTIRENNRIRAINSSVLGTSKVYVPYSTQDMYCVQKRDNFTAHFMKKLLGQ